MNFSHSLHNFQTLPSFKTRDIATMCRWAIVQARLGDPWAGLGLAYMAHERAVRTHDRRDTMLALNASAMCHATRNDEMMALGAAVDAVLLAQELGDQVEADQALATIAGCPIPASTLEESAGLLADIAERAAQRRDYDLEIRARANLAVVLGDRLRFEEAEAELTEVFRLFAEHSDEAFSQARIHLNLANLHRKHMLHLISCGEIDAATAIFHRAVAVADQSQQLAEQEQNVPVQVLTRGILGGLYRAHGDGTNAIRILADALPLARQSHVQGQLPFILSELAEGYAIVGDTKQYTSTLELALNEAVTQRPTERAEQLCRKLCAQAEADGRAEDAAFWLRRADLEQRDFALAHEQVGRQVRELYATYSQACGGINSADNAASGEPGSGA
ncbi:MAG: hypothetical protein HY255_05050 [Betaproteobacteria bacterium]|nr:hypothetical protein [Betaproteobacteria bacterium]